VRCSKVEEVNRVAGGVFSNNEDIMQESIAAFFFRDNGNVEETEIFAIRVSDGLLC